MLARFIFHSSARESAVANYWDQQLVLIENVEIVKGADGVIPSTVRLYANHNRTEHGRRSNMYINASKFSFELCSRFVEHKSCPLVDLGGIDLFEHNKPSVVERRLEIVNGIPKNQGQLAE